MRRSTKLSGLLRSVIGGAPEEGQAARNSAFSRRGAAGTPPAASAAAGEAAVQASGSGWLSAEDLNPKLREAQARAGGRQQRYSGCWRCTHLPPARVPASPFVLLAARRLAPPSHARAHTHKPPSPPPMNHNFPSHMHTTVRRARRDRDPGRGAAAPAGRGRAAALPQDYSVQHRCGRWPLLLPQRPRQLRCRARRLQQRRRRAALLTPLVVVLNPHPHPTTSPPKMQATLSCWASNR